MSPEFKEERVSCRQRNLDRKMRGAVFVHVLLLGECSAEMEIVAEDSYGLHTHIRTHTHTRTQTRTHICIHIQIYIQNTNIHTKYIFVCMCIYIYVYIYVYIYICVYMIRALVVSASHCGQLCAPNLCTWEQRIGVKRKNYIHVCLCIHIYI